MPVTNSPRKLGDLSLRELIDSIDREVGGFIKLVEDSNPDDLALFRDAYIASIRVRLVLAKSKIDSLGKELGR